MPSDAKVTGAKVPNASVDFLSQHVKQTSKASSTKTEQLSIAPLLVSETMGSRKRMRRRRIFRGPSLPTIHEQPHEELLAALELVELFRQKSAKDRLHHGRNVVDDDDFLDQSPSSRPSSPNSSAFCLEFVGKLIDLSNLVSSPDLEQHQHQEQQQWQQPSDAMQSSLRSSFAEVESDTWEQRPPLHEIYPTRRNVEAIAELDVEKVLHDSLVVMRKNKRRSDNSCLAERSISSSRTTRSGLQQQIPQARTTTNTRSRPLSDGTSTSTGSSSSTSSRTHAHQDSPQNNHTTQSSSSSSSSPRRGQLVDSIEISPGISKSLRGADETTRAIESGFIELQECLCCSVPLVYVADAEFVLCPKCRVISSTSNKNRGTSRHYPCRPRPISFWGSPAGGVGLGLLAGSLPRVG